MLPPFAIPWKPPTFFLERVRREKRQPYLFLLLWPTVFLTRVQKTPPLCRLENGVSINLQSVIITGESGAGKSEACKLVLQFIADLSAAHSGRTVTEDEQSLEQQLLQVRG